MIKWVVVIDLIHYFIVILIDSLSSCHVASNLVWHHFLLLLFSQLFHLVVNTLSHLAMVEIEEVLSGLHCSESLLLWMAKIEVALRIVEE